MICTDGVHLVADSLAELHEFAARVGLRREWYQSHPRHPHYDLTTAKVAKRAVRAGAKAATARVVARMGRCCAEREATDGDHA